jgi:hypothetical protein
MAAKEKMQAMTAQDKFDRRLTVQDYLFSRKGKPAFV